jgi:hypothetical protein
VTYWEASHMSWFVTVTCVSPSLHVDPTSFFGNMNFRLLFEICRLPVKYEKEFRPLDGGLVGGFHFTVGFRSDGP